LDQINETVAAALTAAYNDFTNFKIVLAAYFDGWAELVAGADEVAIIQAQISFQAQRAVEITGNAAFYKAYLEQEVRASWKAVADATVAYLNAVASGTAAQIATARTNLETAVETSVYLQVDYRRADELEDVVKAEVDRIKDLLDAKKTELENAATRAWAAIRADLIARFNAEVEEHRRRLTDYLAGIRCDFTAATLTVQTDANNADAEVVVQLRGVNCYTDLSGAELDAAFCASLTAYFVNEGAVATVNTYSCATVTAKKRFGLQSGSAVAADMTASDQSTPTPVDTSNSASFVACIVLLLVAFLFHF